MKLNGYCWDYLNMDRFIRFIIDIFFMKSIETLRYIEVHIFSDSGEKVNKVFHKQRKCTNSMIFSLLSLLF